MNKPWDQLPREVLIQIFQHLAGHLRSLSQTHITCRGWSAAARSILYKRITVQEGNPQQGIRFLQTLKTGDESIKSAIQSLSILEDNDDNYHILGMVAKLCSNLRHLDVPLSTTRNYYSVILALLKEGCLQKLEIVSPPSDRYACKYEYRAETIDYDNIMLALMKTSTSLTLFEEPPENSNTTAISFPLAEHLTSFNALKNLTIEVVDDISFFDIACLLRSLPCLEKFTLLTENYLKSCHQSIDQHLDQSFSLKSMKIVHLELQALSLADIRFIMTTFPALGKITIDFPDDMQPSSPDMVDDDTPETTFAIQTFLEYISRVEQFSFKKWILPPGVLLGSLQGLSKYFRLDSLYIQASTEFPEQLGLSISSKGRLPYDNGKLVCDISFGLENDMFNRDLLNFIKIGPEVTDISIVGDYTSPHFEDMSICLDHIFTQLPYLRKIYLQFLELYPLENTVSKQSRRLRLEELEMDRCAIESDAFITQISQRISHVDKLNISSDYVDGVGDNLIQIDMSYTSFVEVIF